MRSDSAGTRAGRSRTAELLIVEEDEIFRRWTQRVLSEHGYPCETTAHGGSARRSLRTRPYKLALLDVQASGDSGMDLLADIRRSHPDMAVLVVSAEDSMGLALSAIELGAHGYLVKPLGEGELLISIANALHRRLRELESERSIRRLHASAEDRGQELESALRDLHLSENNVPLARSETIFRLARLVEFPNEQTGAHVHRMSAYCEVLCARIGLAGEHRELVRLASQLHDVGKVAVPDSILLKHGKLTAEEFALVKRHAETGYRMLAGSPSKVVALGGLIARTHHEHWNGRGYPRGLAGNAIPLEGRVAAVADVFEALTSDRVHRPALPVKSAVEIMRGEGAQHFDPEILGALPLALAELEDIRRAFAE